MIYLTLFLEFFKVGLFCFGGAFGMIPLIEEVVLKHGWLSYEQFYSFIGVCESTPGPIAVNMATYIGAVKGGILGSIVATLGVVLPSFIIILLVASALSKLTENKHFKSFMKGVKPVIAGLILSTGLIILAKSVFKESKFDLVSAIIFVVICITEYVSNKLFNKKLSSIWIIVISAILGIALMSIKKVVSN